MENSEPLPTSLITDSTTTTTTHHHITGPKIVEHTLPASILQCNRLATIRLMQTAHFSAPIGRQMRLHIDGGANRSITNDKNNLLNFKNIKTYYMSSANDENDIKCTGIGYLTWRADHGDTILIRCFYSPQAVDTIISPSDIVLNHISTYHTWTHHADMVSGKGHIAFANNTTKHSITFPLTEHNGLWYSNITDCADYQSLLDDQPYKPMIKRVTSAGMYELIHARLGHPGERIMSTLHLHVDGTTKLTKPPFHKCKTCMMVKATRRALTQTQHYGPSTQKQHMQDQPMLHSDAPGTRFHMDMGFVRGSNFSHKHEDGHLVTSLDGYNSYLLIIDRATRYTWVFLSKYKTPPIPIIKSFLNTRGASAIQQCFIRTDEGGELWGSHHFQ